jgi:hypothetical protein
VIKIFCAIFCLVVLAGCNKPANDNKVEIKLNDHSLSSGKPQGVWEKRLVKSGLIHTINESIYRIERLESAGTKIDECKWLSVPPVDRDSFKGCVAFFSPDSKFRDGSELRQEYLTRAREANLDPGILNDVKQEIGQVKDGQYQSVQIVYAEGMGECGHIFYINKSDLYAVTDCLVISGSLNIEHLANIRSSSGESKVGMAPDEVWTSSDGAKAEVFQAKDNGLTINSCVWRESPPKDGFRVKGCVAFDYGQGVPVLGGELAKWHIDKARAKSQKSPEELRELAAAMTGSGGFEKDLVYRTVRLRDESDEDSDLGCITLIHRSQSSMIEVRECLGGLKYDIKTFKRVK